MDDVLVIGYGSDLRGDDAAGRRAAEAVAARRLPGVRVLSLPQLAPEVAAELIGCRRAIFVDASTADDEVTVRTVACAAPDWRLHHHLAPSSLLALAEAMDSAPPAVMVTIPASTCALGTSLSPSAARAVSAAVDRIVDLCGMSTA